MGRPSKLARIVAVVLLVMVGVPIIGIAPSGADSPGPQTPLANPLMPESCGSNVALVLDASGSIQSSHAVDDVRDSAASFLDALADTGSTARVLQFASLSEELAPQAEVTTQSLQGGGAFQNAIEGYYNPIPPRRGQTNIYQYDGGGDPQSSGNWRVSNSSNQYTNWDQSLDQAGQPQPKPIELVVYVTDGDPTGYDFNQPGDPFRAGPPPDVGINTDRGSAAQTTMDRAVQEANQIKASGARMLAVGVGSAVTGNTSSRNRLIQIAGPQTVDDSDLASVTSINDVDVALVRDFDKLATFLRNVVNELCTPSLTVRKLAQTAGSAEYTPAENWAITTQPTVAGGGSTYQWILPDTDPAQSARCGNPANPNDQASRTCLTDSTGIASFQWEPNPGTANTSAVVTETPQPGYTPGRPNDTDWRCTLKNSDGTQETEEGEFGTPPLGFTLDVDPNQIITCVVYNSFDYAPDINLVKVDAPTQVRGDLSPPNNTVTSTFSVTNPGNTPLADVDVTDDHCNPTFVSGDANGDDLLAPANGETWIFRCTRNLTSSAGSPPRAITNIAEATGVDPNGEQVSAIDNDTVTVYAPAIALTKTANVSEVEVGVPTAVTYTYVATNAGNMTLNNVTVTDNTGPATCAPVTPVLPAVPPVSLGPGAQATFTCTTTLTAADPDDTFVNTATVTGNPVFPGGAAAPPAVTATASAQVTAFQTGIELTKSVDRAVVFPGTSVTYTYVVTNTGSVNLVPADPPAPPASPRDGFITDDQGPTGTCAPVTYVSGDTGNDNVLSPAESWTYTCSKVISGAVDSVRNTAMVVAEVVGTGSHLTAFAQAVVEVVQPSITLEKSTVHPVVLDPAAPALSGPDVPLRTPAVYLYTLRNSGNVPVRNVTVDDVYPIPATRTCPVEAVPPAGTNAGDANANGVLDPGEGWQFQCVLRSIGGGHALTKADADTPPGNNPQLPSPVTNTASGSGEAFFQDGAVEATQAVESNDATAVVHVISPSISMTKTPCIDDSGLLTCAPDLLVRPGTDVTYVYEVTNTGDSDVRPIGGLDNRCDVVTFASGDTNGNGLIDGGTSPETWTYRCTTSVDRPSPINNIAGILVVGPLGNTYGAIATAAVRIFEPGISLTKVVSDDLVPAGSAVTYTFEVRNTGNVTDDGLPSEVVLSNIGLLDGSRPANPSCAVPTFVGGNTNGNDTLDLVPPEVWTYQCTGVVTETTTDVAGVGGRDIQNGIVADLAIATVTPYHAGIAVTKVATPTQLPDGGGSVTYSYDVTNTGDVPLADVEDRVTDDKCPNVQPVTADRFNVGDEDHNELLTGDHDLFETGGPEVWKFTCTVDLTVDTVNTVTANGTPVGPGEIGFERLGPDVSAQAQAKVTVGALPTDPSDVSAGGLAQTGLAGGIALALVGLGAIAGGLLLRRRRRVRA